jgi:hypothetical protein
MKLISNKVNLTLDYDIKYYGFRKTLRYKFLKLLSKRYKILYRKSANKHIHIYFKNLKTNFFLNVFLRVLFLDDFKRIEHDIKRYLKGKIYQTNRLFDTKIYIYLTKNNSIEFKEKSADKWRVL